MYWNPVWKLNDSANNIRGNCDDDEGDDDDDDDDDDGSGGDDDDVSREM